MDTPAVARRRRSARRTRLAARPAPAASARARALALAARIPACMLAALLALAGPSASAETAANPTPAGTPGTPGTPGAPSPAPAQTPASATPAPAPATPAPATPAPAPAIPAASIAHAPVPPGMSEDEALRRRRTPVVDVFEQCRDSVVNIASTEVDEVVVRGGSPFDRFFDDFFDLPRREPRTRRFTRRSVGSGFVLHAEGYIVTNAHVVSRTAEELKVIFADGREYDARIVATDRAADLAVLKIEADEPLPPLPLGRSDDLLVGETVVAIGNPLGFQHTVTAGVVSATGRSIEVGRDLAFDDLIQTDASINPGNSGGPLLNVLGELIGVNTAIRGDAQNIGFAISVDRLRESLPELLDVERRYRVMTGLELDPLGPPLVAGVAEDGPADRAGLRPGDRLLAVDGRPVAQAIDFDIALMGRAAGDSVRLRLVRGDEERQLRLELDPRPLPDGAALARTRLGMTVEELPEDVARRLGLRRAGGLVVAAVAPDGPARRTGVERLDVLLALGETYVSSLADLGLRLERVEAGEELPIRVLRVDRRRRVVLNGVIRVD